MAFTVTVDKTLSGGGDSAGLVHVYGTAVNDLGSTGGDLDFGAQGLYDILHFEFTCTSAQEAAQAVKAYDGALASDKITLTTAADATYNFHVVGMKSA